METKSPGYAFSKSIDPRLDVAKIRDYSLLIGAQNQTSYNFAV